MYVIVSCCRDHIEIVCDDVYTWPCCLCTLHPVLYILYCLKHNATSVEGRRRWQQQRQLLSLSVCIVKCVLFQAFSVVPPLVQVALQSTNKIIFIKHSNTILLKVINQATMVVL